MNLISAYERHDDGWLLYRLLGERDESVNISHKTMPCVADHIKFFKSKPYEAWYLILENAEPVGACYLSKQNEIGVQIFKRHQGKGYGKAAVQELMKRHGKRRYLANINPQNERSAKMFKDLGFGLIQHTYEAIA
jgi:RimJ/RimL family protein N-acetyltransferase